MKDKKEMLKKIFIPKFFMITASILAVIVIFYVIEFSISNSEKQIKPVDQKTTPKKSVTVSTTQTEYPKSISKKYKDIATTAPDIIFRTSGKENGLLDSIYFFEGVVKSVFADEFEDPENEEKTIPVNCMILSTERGNVYFYDLYSYLLETSGDLYPLFVEKGADYSIPKVDEYVKVYAIYQGFSEVYHMPAAIYGVPQRIAERNEDKKTDQNQQSTKTNNESTNDISSQNNKKSDVTEASKSEQNNGSSQKNNNTVPKKYQNALEKAKQYNKTLHLSKKSLYDQLTSQYGEKFTAEEAQYAVDNLKADYKENALIQAEKYNKSLHLSKKGLYDQLKSDYGEKFTAEEAQYAVDNLKADYKENALIKAKNYSDTLHLSKQELYNQLKSDYGEKFTAEETQYAVDHLSE